MKNYIAVYTGTEAARNKWLQLDEATRKEREQAGMKAWGEWVRKHQDSVVDFGAPLGKTLRIDPSGIAPAQNELAAYTVVRAESQEDAAKMFLNHPHFTLFPGSGVEVMECLPVPGMK